MGYPRRGSVCRMNEARQVKPWCSTLPIWRSRLSQHCRWKIDNLDVSTSNSVCFALPSYNIIFQISEKHADARLWRSKAKLSLWYLWPCYLDSGRPFHHIPQTFFKLCWGHLFSEIIDRYSRQTVLYVTYSGHRNYTMTWSPIVLGKGFETPS